MEIATSSMITDIVIPVVSILAGAYYARQPRVIYERVNDRILWEIGTTELDR